VFVMLSCYQLVTSFAFYESFFKFFEICAAYCDALFPLFLTGRALLQKHFWLRCGAGIHEVFLLFPIAVVIRKDSVGSAGQTEPVPLVISRTPVWLFLLVFAGA